MIANVSPAAIHYEDTLNTLNYANRAKNIRVTLRKNILEKENLIELNDKNSKGVKGTIGIAMQDKVVNNLKNEIFELRKLLNDKNDPIKKKSKITLKNIFSAFNILKNNRYQSKQKPRTSQKP